MLENDMQNGMLTQDGMMSLKTENLREVFVKNYV